MLSVVLSTAGRDLQRVQNLNETLYCLDQQTYQDWELILIEQNLDGNLYNHWISCDQYIPVRDPEDRGFNVSWLRNIGAIAAKGERLLFLDADTVFPPGFLERVAAFEGDPHFFAAEYFIWIPRSKKIKYLTERDPQVWMPPSDQDMKVFQGGAPNNIAICFDRNWYVNHFGGYVENFFHWGYEDNEANERLCKLLNKRFSDIQRVPNAFVGHLFHTNRDFRSKKENLNKAQALVEADYLMVIERLKKKGIGNPQSPSLIQLPTDETSISI